MTHSTAATPGETQGLPAIRTAIACRACPAGTDPKAFVIAIAEGRYLDAYRHARARNPLASICGRICPAPCESACTRGDTDEPVSIRALERFVCEQFGPESPNDNALWAALSASRRSQECGMHVAIAGAGPAGLTAAHDLMSLGYRVIIFEECSQVGGDLLAIPEHLLSPAVRDAEIDAVIALGVHVQTDCRVGRDVRIEDLAQEGVQALLTPDPAEGDCPFPVYAIEPASSIVEAVAAGHKAAAVADAALTGIARARVTAWALSPAHAPPPSYATRLLPPHAALDGQLIELSYSEPEAREQAERCLRCHIDRESNQAFEDETHDLPL